MCTTWCRMVCASVIMVVLTAAGCSDIDIGPDDELPVAIIDVDPMRNIQVGETVVFDGSRSHDPGDGTGPSVGIEAFLWSLRRIPDGGGNLLSRQRQPSTELVPDAPGIWTVQLTVTDGEGLEDDAEREIRVDPN